MMYRELQRADEPLKSIYSLIFMISFLPSLLAGDVANLDGRIDFHPTIDSESKMTLTSVGLGIGTTPSSNLHVNGNAIISGRLSLGSTSGSSNLNIMGSIAFSPLYINSETTCGSHAINLVDSTADNIHITMPYAGNLKGQVFTLKKTSPLNTVWVNGGGNFIDDSNQLELRDDHIMSSVSLISTGERWLMTRSRGVNKTVASDNLVGFWTFTETTGTQAFDSSSYLNHGDLHGSLNFSGNTNSGPVDQSLALDGIDDRIDIADSDIHTFGNGTEDQPFSLSVWFKPQSNGCILAKATSPNTGEYYILVVGTTLYFRLVDDSNFSRIGVYDNDGIVSGNWHHVVATYDGTASTVGMKLYINGSEVVTASDVHGTYVAMENTTRVLRIASRDHPFFVQCQIDEVRVYSKTLSHDEIKALYLEGQ